MFQLGEDMTLIQGDCLEVMREMDANSVDAIITDPPYYKVKGEAWDNQWDTPAKFLEWVGLLCEQFERILKPNGSLYFFASPQMAARVECEIGKRFAVLNSITWRKGAAGKSAVGWSQKTEKEALRMWLPESERIIFAEHYGADNMAKGEAGYEAKCDELRGFVFEPLRSYLAEEVKRAGWTPAGLNEAMGFAPRGMAETRYFGRSQWQLPTEPHYAKMRELLGVEYLRREYEDLRREYEDLRREYEDLRFRSLRQDRRTNRLPTSNRGQSGACPAFLPARSQGLCWRSWRSIRGIGALPSDTLCCNSSIALWALTWRSTRTLLHQALLRLSVSGRSWLRFPFVARSAG